MIDVLEEKIEESASIPPYYISISNYQIRGGEV
jgi:hypothetical protein